MIGFGGDAERCDPADLARMQASLDETLPGYQVLDDGAPLASRRVLARDVGDPPPGLVRAPSRRDAPAQGNVILAGSDLAYGLAAGLHRRGDRVRPACGRLGARARLVRGAVAAQIVRQPVAGGLIVDTRMGRCFTFSGSSAGGSCATASVSQSVCACDIRDYPEGPPRKERQQRPDDDDHHVPGLPLGDLTSKKGESADL